jgi:hypothetical protein
MSARWLLPWFCLLLVTTGFAYGVSAALCGAQATAAAAEPSEAAPLGRSTPTLVARPYSGMGIAREQDPYTPAQLQAIDSLNDECDATWMTFAACLYQAREVPVGGTSG